MTIAEIIAQAKRIAADARNERHTLGALAEARQFLRVMGGETSDFYRLSLLIEEKTNESYMAARISSVLEAFVRHLESGLGSALSPTRQAQLDTVSDFLEQAQALLERTEYHPAAAAVIIGAALEEHLRNWTEREVLSLDGKRPSLDSYATLLRSRELITKQDMKDIVSWAGSRNDAAHGDWTKVEDRERIRLMLEGVNLFMRKYP